MSAQINSYQYDSLEARAQVKEFERLYRQASTLIGIERQIWIEIGILPGVKILDVGCGSGVITQELASYVYPGEVVGVDLSKSLIDKCQQSYHLSRKAQKIHPEEKIVFKQGDIYDLPFPEGSFDVVHTRFVFQHLSNPNKALNSIFRVLKPGGLLCVLDGDKGWSGLSPEPEVSVRLDKAIIDRQLARGGDPWVGRKLSFYLNSTGFSGVKTNITLIDSDQLGFSNYIDMLAFRSPPTGKKDELADLREDVQSDLLKLINSHYAWAGFALFVTTGRK